MKSYLIKGILLVLSIISIIHFPASPVYASPDDVVLQAAAPEQLEIQLGLDWAGVEFQLKTDFGMYPERIPVDSDGVLRLEIGGSETYILSCFDAAVAVPKPKQEDEDIKGSTEVPEQQLTEESEEVSTVSGVPVRHIVFFAGGMLVSVTVLIVMKIVSRRKNRNDYDEEE